MERERELSILIDALKRYYQDLAPVDLSPKHDLPQVIKDHTRKVRDDVASMIEGYVREQGYLENKHKEVVFLE